jgi:hypothetical protein
MKGVEARFRCAHMLCAIGVGIAGVSFGSTPAFAWSGDGHRIVALIAAHELDPRAKIQVETLLSGDSMADVSTWADTIKFHRHETSPWHYVDIEIDSQGYNAARDCPAGDCVVAQIERNERIVGDRSLAIPARAEALKFLIHFVGDLHQPLHCADNHDRGGNEVRVVLNGNRKNLHAVWDTEVVEALGDDPGTVATALERNIMPEQKQQWSKGTIADWANQSFQIAKTQIYGTLPTTGGTDAPVIVPPDYAQREGNVTRTQLERAGVRLAAILNKILSR